MTFLPESLIGIPNIMDVYCSGNVAIVNAPGNGVADDKGIYYFVPKMIRYYLDQEPILKNAPTYLPFYEEDRKYVLDNLEKLVVKDVAEAGGYGVIFGNELSREKLADMKALIEKESRRFIAQEVIDFQDMEVMEGEDNPDSLYSNMKRAYDNAVVLRDELSSTVLSYVQLALDTFEACRRTTAPLLELQQVLDDLLAFWGGADDYVEEEDCRNILKCGKYVERLDLCIRLDYHGKDLEKEYRKLCNRLKRTSLNYSGENLQRLEEIILKEEDSKSHYKEALICLGGLFI